MEKYIAFLRGVNVGGKNKISMPILRTVFEEIGFKDVATYINSGNVFFTSEIKEKDQLIRKCEVAIKKSFELNIPVLIITAKELADVLEHAPAWWNVDKEAVNYAMFVIAPVSTQEVFTEMGGIKPEYEQIDHYGDVIFWAAPRETFNKSRWSKIASSAVNDHVTIRNANTVNKMLTMAK